MRGRCLLLLLAAGWAGAQAPPFQYLRAGNARDVHVRTRGGFALMGGGTDLDEAFQWMCQRSGNGDFLIVRASGTAAYNPYVQKLCPQENSVATLILPSRAAAAVPAVAAILAHASAIFLAGGDQSNYINYWMDTAVAHELNAAIRRGVPLGGTSAGLAVLGEFAYSAQNDGPHSPNLTSAMALANPFHPQVALVRHFVAIPPLRGVITDSHFHNRDRLGRLLVFMARILQSRDAASVHALGVDQHTAVLLNPGGQAIVAGTGAAYFFAATGSPALCRAGEPLDFAPIAVERLQAGQHFDFTSWTGTGAAYTLEVDSGAVRSTQAGGGIY